MRLKNPKTKEKRPLRVAGYVRVSSQRQANEGDSLIAQQHEIEQEVDFRKRREGWEIEGIEFYVDAGRSAKDQNRAQLQRLKRDITAGKIDLVICFKLDRITRSLRDFVDLWALFESHDVDVISLREKFDTSMPTGTAMLQLVMVFAQLERSMTAERTYSIMRDRVDRGLWNGGHVLGYRSDPEDKGKLLIEEEGAVIVRRIFDSYEELGSAGAATRKLNDLGIRYPTYRTRSDKVRGGNLFTKQKVLGILRSPIYIGRIEWGEATCDDCHVPIIAKEQFERVKDRLIRTVKHRKNMRRARGRNYLLSGLLRCQCGSHMVGSSAHGRTDVSYYYTCTRQVHEGGKYSCEAPRIPALALEEALIGRVVQLGSLVEARDQIVRKALDCIDGESARLREEEDILRRQIAKTKADIGRLIEVLKSLGTRGLPSVQEELGRLEAEEKHLAATLAELGKRQAPMDKVSREARQFIETWKDVGELLAQATPDEQFQILQHYVEVIELQTTDPKARSGTYVLRLFPEVRPNRALEYVEERPKAEVKSGPETENGAVADAGNRPDSLTEPGLVRISVQKAPRVGFEPTTRRLTVDCSTAELPGNGFASKS